MAALEPSPDLHDRSRSSRDGQSAQQHRRTKSRRMGDRGCPAAHTARKSECSSGGLQRGDPINVYSQSASSWLVGEVTQVDKGTHIHVQYKVGEDMFCKRMHVHSCDLDIPSAINCSIRPAGAEPQANPQDEDWGIKVGTTRSSPHLLTMMQKSCSHGEEETVSDDGSHIAIAMEKCNPGMRGRTTPDDEQSDSGIIAISFCKNDVSKSSNKSKIRYEWLLNVDGDDYKIRFENSRASGKKRVFMNGKLLTEQKPLRNKGFNHDIFIGRHRCSISPSSSRSFNKCVDFDLQIDNRNFDTFKPRGGLRPIKKSSTTSTPSEEFAPISDKDTALLEIPSPTAYLLENMDSNGFRCISPGRAKETTSSVAVAEGTSSELSTCVGVTLRINPSMADQHMQDAVEPQPDAQLFARWIVNKGISTDSARSRNMLILSLCPSVTDDDLKKRCEYLMWCRQLEFTWHCFQKERDCSKYIFDLGRKVRNSKDDFIHLDVSEEYSKQDVRDVMAYIKNVRGHPCHCQGLFVNSAHIPSSDIIDDYNDLFGGGHHFHVAGWERNVPIEVQTRFFVHLYMYLHLTPTTLKDAVSAASLHYIDFERFPVFIVPRACTESCEQVEDSPDLAESDIAGLLHHFQETSGAKVEHNITLHVDPSPSEKIRWDNVVQACGQPDYWQNCLPCASQLSWVEVIIDTNPKMSIPCVVTSEAIHALEKELREKLKVVAYIRSFESLPLSLVMHAPAFLDLRSRWQDIEISTPVEWGEGEVMISGISLGKSLWMQFVTSFVDAQAIDTIQIVKEHLSTKFQIDVHDDSQAVYPGKGFSKRSSSASTESGTQIVCQSDVVRLPPEIPEPGPDRTTMEHKDAVNLRCPNGHTLKQFITDHERFYCNVCRKITKTRSTLFGCRDCDYDECEICHSKPKGLTEMAAQEETVVADYEAYVKEVDIQKAKRTRDDVDADAIYYSDDNTVLYVMVIDNLTILQELTDTEVVCRWCVNQEDQAIHCSSSFVISSSNTTSPSYCAFLVCSFPDMDVRDLALTFIISSVKTGEYLAACFTDVSLFCTSATFVDVSLIAQDDANKDFAKMSFHTAAQNRWQKNAPIVSQALAYFVNPQEDAQAKCIFDHVVGDIAEEPGRQEGERDRERHAQVDRFRRRNEPPVRRSPWLVDKPRRTEGDMDDESDESSCEI